MLLAKPSMSGPTVCDSQIVPRNAGKEKELATENDEENNHSQESRVHAKIKEKFRD